MRFSFPQKLLGIILLFVIGIIFLPFMLFHENIANPVIHQYKSPPSAPLSAEVKNNGAMGLLIRLKTHAQLLLHKPPKAWMVKSTNVLSEADANNIVAALQKQEVSAYVVVLDPSRKTASIKLGPVVKHEQAEEILAKLQNSFPQIKGTIVGYDPMKD